MARLALQLVLCVVGGFAAASPAHAESNVTWRAPEDFSGAVLVARGDAVVYRAAFGFADEAAGVRTTPETVFRIGSVTKTLTAALALALAERDGWSLEEPLGRRWPELPTTWRALTPHLLLSHQTGLAEFTTEPGFDRADGPVRAFERMRQIIGDRPLGFVPGSGVSYSNSNYVLLGAWLERIEGRSYATLLRENVLRPAGMLHTVTAAKGNHAVGYGASAPGWETVAERDPGVLDAAGALASNVDDLWLFVRGLQTGKILTVAGRQRLNTMRSPEFSYGWRRRLALGRELRFQVGQVRGFSAALMEVMGEDLWVIVISNRETQRALEIALELIEAFSKPRRE